MEEPMDDASAPNLDADLPAANGGDEGVVAEDAAGYEDQDAAAMDSTPPEPDTAAVEASPEDGTAASALEPDAAEVGPEAAAMQPEPAAEANAAEASPEPAAAEAAAPLAEPETAEPETAEPETAEPETAEPETAEPEAAEPETAEEPDMAPAVQSEAAAEQLGDAPDSEAPVQDAEAPAAAAGDEAAQPEPAKEQDTNPPAAAPEAGEDEQDAAQPAAAAAEPEPIAPTEPSPPPAEAEAEMAGPEAEAEAGAEAEAVVAAAAAPSAEPQAEAAAEPEPGPDPVPEQEASSRPASGAGEPKAASRPATAASGAGEHNAGSRPASGAGEPKASSRPATAASGAGEPKAASRPASGAGEPKASSRPATAASGAAEPKASSRPPTAESSLVATAISRSASRAASAPQSYDKGAFMQPIDADVQLPLDSVPTTHILSLDSHKRNNIAYIEDDVLVTAAGNNVVFVRLSDMSQSYMPGLDGGGIGAIAVHPTRKFLAVAEKCRHRSPNVYIYSYPELILNRVMRSGTERAYSALSFNERGNMLATVGGYPDFLITLWNWDEESIILRSKAFSQDVYTVQFSPYFEGLLNTSGTGHIRFWKVATTFTGLKLQGQLGKFGAVELTDVVAFVEMPDGKVLSSTETGELLLWDGGLIKVVLMRPGKKPCHDGAIHVLLHDRSSNCIVTGGADGYVRLWQFSKINEAEAEEDSNYLCITPVDELHIPGARIKSLIWERHHWVIQDEAGALFKVTLPQDGVLSKGATVTRLLEFHSGGIVGMHLSPASHTAVTAGADGSLRVYDYAALRLLRSTAFNQPASVLTPLDATGQVLAAGFDDGVLRLVRRCADGAVAMLSACKPHKGAVTAIALSPDGRRLATAGEDGTVFFFVPDDAAGGIAAGALKPVAFTAAPAAVSCAVWTADAKALLCGTVAGTVVEVVAPQLDEVDSSRTFEVSGLVNRKYTFKCPKAPKKKVKKDGEGGEEGSGEEGAAAANTPAAEGEASEKPAEGEAAEGQAAEGEGKEDKEEEEVKDEEAEAMKVLTIRLAGQGSGELLLTLDGKAAGTVWQCSLDSPAELPAAPYAPACGATSLLPGLVLPAPAPTTFFSYGGRGGALMLMGSADGSVRVQQAAPAPAGGAQGRFWQASLHDMQEGAVTSVQVSFDGAYLLSAAMDGTLYVQAMNFSGPAEPAPSGSESLLPQSACSPLTPDITNPAEYTIEEAKQKAEQDALMAAAETKKMGVREFLAHIRKEFEALLSENQARPEAERLPRLEFEIDPGLRDMMEVEAKQKEEEARLELAWETEKKRLALAKLKAFFLDKVEVERIVMYALQSKVSVTTFRTAKLPDDIQAELAAMQKQQQELQLAAQEMGGAGAARQGRADGSDGPLLGTALSMMHKKSTDPSTQSTGDDSSRLTKADMRRLARKKREAEWASFSATRPDDKYENPADVAAIEEAERNMGDFKLKSDPSYVIPEEERMTPQRKRLQMLLLEEAIYKVKMDFNHRFLALREVKKKVISEINGRLLKLKDIEAQLALRDAAATPAAPGSVIAAGFTTELALKPEEQPEIREIVTEEDLEEFARKKEEEKKAAQGSGLGGFAGGGGGGAVTAPPTAAAGAKRAGAAGAKTPGAKAGGAAGQPEPGSNAAMTADEAISKMMAAVPLSEFERALQAFQKKRLDHAKAKLQEEVSEMVEAFDEALGSLRREKFKLEADVKMAEMKQLVHYQELVLLRDFDKREVILIQKRQTKLDDRKEILDKIGECNSKLEQKRVELEGLISRRAAVLADFDSLVPESDPFREPLSKIFHRRIKRSKKKASAEEDEDGEEEEEEEEDGEEGDEDDDDGDEEVCPPGCDNSLYERVCEQREKRLDEDDLITEFQKTIEVVRKEKETAAKKQKLVEQSLAAIQQDITEFQREKQGRLNQIDVVVNLKMHQIEYLVDGRLPVDLSQGLVFSDKELEKLKRRIEELDQEKADLRARQKTLKKEHLQLLRDKRAKEARVAELEAKAYDVQMLKFGQVIDLDLLDRIGASKGTEELKEQLKSQEAQYAKELVEWDKKISARTDELMALTRENTNCLNAVSELTMSQRKLESSLATARTTMFSDPVVQRKQEVEERDQLVQLVNAQATEIQKLKAQINALHRKDTSVYQ